MLLRTPEVMEGGLCLLEVLEVPDVMCCALLCMLEAVEGEFSFGVSIVAVVVTIWVETPPKRRRASIYAVSTPQTGYLSGISASIPTQLGRLKSSLFVVATDSWATCASVNSRSQPASGKKFWGVKAVLDVLFKACTLWASSGVMRRVRGCYRCCKLWPAPGLCDDVLDGV